MLLPAGDCRICVTGAWLGIPSLYFSVSFKISIVESYSKGYYFPPETLLDCFSCIVKSWCLHWLTGPGLARDPESPIPHPWKGRAGPRPCLISLKTVHLLQRWGAQCGGQRLSRPSLVCPQASWEGTEASFCPRLSFTPSCLTGTPKKHSVPRVWVPGTQIFSLGSGGGGFSLPGSSALTYLNTQSCCSYILEAPSFTS